MIEENDTGIEPTALETQTDITNAFEQLLTPPTEDTENEADDEALQGEEDEAIEAEFDEPGEDEDAEDGDIEETLELTTVTIGDETLEVTPQVAEKLEQLEKSGLRQSDYTKKTQALAEQRKGYEAELAKVQQERSQLEVLLPQLVAELQAEITPEVMQQLEALRDVDPTAYLVEKDRIALVQGRIQAAKDEQKRLSEIRADEQAKAHKERLQAEGQMLMEALPEWKKPEVRNKESAEIREYGISMGFSADEMNLISDHRAIQVFRDAMQANRAKSNQPKARTRVKTAKAGTSNVPKKSALTVAQKRLKETGSVRDASAVFEQLLSKKG